MDKLGSIVVILVIASFLHLGKADGDHDHHHADPQQPSGEPANKLILSKEHILEDLERQINTKDKKDFTDEEMNFYYFKLHDFDKNNVLDGLEIVKAIRHQHEEHNDDENHKSPEFSEEQLIKAVDSVLSIDDLNGDGFVSFAEFMAMQGKGGSPPS